MKRILFPLLFLYAFSTVSGQADRDHPFLLLDPGGIDSLRGLAALSPWKECAQHAMEDFSRLSYDPAMGNFGDKASSLRDMISAATLCYLLDTAGSRVYLDSLDRYLGYLDNIYETRRDPPTDWDSNVPVASAAFNAILCLDIIHNDLPAGVREGHEARIGRLVDENQGWYLSEYALRGLWALYSGDTTGAQNYIGLYNQRLESLVTPDGIFNGGTGYSTSRFVKDQREHKFCFMDVVEYQGLGNYYGNPRYRNLYEWIFNHNFTTYGSILTFGDAKRGTSARRKLYESPATYRASRFSERAGSLAAWHVRDTLPQGRLLIYLLMENTPGAVRPDSGHLYPDGGAFFLQNPSHAEHLSSTLWNCRSESGHSHKDVNALGLSAFGEDLLVNSGYNNWGNGKLGFSWDYIHDQAISGNTALINGLDHRSKSGNGIVRGFIAPPLGYARGHSGEALTGGIHERSLIQIDGDSLRSGYWVVWDGIRAEIPYSFVHIPYHPVAEKAEVIRKDRQYRWKIQRWAESPVSLEVILTTPPRKTSLEKGLLADKSYSIIGEYLLPDYMSDFQGRASVASILYPHTTDKPLPEVETVSFGSLHATLILHTESFTDLVLSSHPDSLLAGPGLEFMGEAALLRMKGDSVFSLLAENTRFLKNCGGKYTGFASDVPATLHLSGDQGHLFLEEDAVIDLYYPGIRQVHLDGLPVEPLKTGENHIRFHAGAGTSLMAVLHTPPDSIIDPLPCGRDTAVVTGTPEPSIAGALPVLSIYPNPAADFVRVDWEGNWGETVLLEVFDMTGKVLLSKKFTPPSRKGVTRLDCGEWHPGIYYLRAVPLVRKGANPVCVRLLVR